ncbi:MAG: thioredoxin domain-containing protein [Kiloniellaceae bacterium]
MLDSLAPLVNRLAEETSPYLLQHKDNPVAWQPWGPAAFEAAKQANKPVLLSVGYAACHWCHVMAHESFETEAIATRMNELFVNVKVDREERPDVDSIYQQALALLGEQGGWPLTMFLTPDGEPFWGGTYFPPEPRYGRPGFLQVLQAIAEVYAKEPERVAKNVAALKQALRALSTNAGGAAISLEVTDRIAERLAREVDPFEGGIGHAPKFPQCAVLKLLWRAWKRTGAQPYRNAVELTLTKMCHGGIYDHLGGGFARYAVDHRWLVPHFEKMLYDNAQLIDVLTWAWQDSGNPLYAQRVRETIDWVLREMIADGDGSGAAPTGAFASTLDADSEGEEGKFYVWTEAEVDAVLGDEATPFKIAYDVTPQGNWEGKTILNRSRNPRLGDPAEEARLADLRARLLAARTRRVRPGWDDKVLADWNGLMIAALAGAAPVFEEPAWLAAAERAFDFVTRTMTADGRLKHAWRHGRLNHPALLDDYANMAEAALALAEATGDPAYLRRAQGWVEILDGHYWDDAAGGYFLSADDTERLLMRTKTAHDSAQPAGNGTMVGVLARLYYLTGNGAYRERAEALVAAFSGEVERSFFSLATLLNGNELLQRAVQIVIVGDREADDARALLRAVYRVNLPNRVLQVVAPDQPLPAAHPAHGKGQVGGAATAYVCRGTSCSLPLTDPAELRRALAA